MKHKKGKITFSYNIMCDFFFMETKAVRNKKKFGNAVWTEVDVNKFLKGTKGWIHTIPSRIICFLLLISFSCPKSLSSNFCKWGKKKERKEHFHFLSSKVCQISPQDADSEVSYNIYRSFIKNCLNLLLSQKKLRQHHNSRHTLVSCYWKTLFSNISRPKSILFKIEREIFSENFNINDNNRSFSVLAATVTCGMDLVTV